MSAARPRTWPWSRADLASWGWLGASYALSAGFSFAYVALAGNRLGPAAAADFYSGLFTIYLLAMLVWPLGGALSRTAAAAVATGRGAGLPDHHRRIYSATLLGAPVIAATAALAAPALARALELSSAAPLWLALAAGTILAVLAVDRGLLRGAGDFRAFASSQAVESALRLLVGALALLARPSATLALAAYLPATVGAWLLSRRQVASLEERLTRSGDVHPRQPLRSAPDGLADTWRWVLPLLALAVAEASYQNLDPLIAKSTLSAETSGAYGAAAAFARTFGVLASPFVATALPDASGAWARGDSVLVSFIRSVAAYLLVCAAPLALCLLYPGAIVRALLGQAFDEAATLLPIFALAWVAGSAALIAAQALVAAGRLGFLSIYLAGVGIEVWLLLRTQPDAIDMARITLWVKAGLLLALVAALALYRKPKGALPRTPGAAIAPDGGE